MAGSLPENLLSAVRQWGGQPAIQTASGIVSYECLWARTLRTAHLLSSRGLRRGDRVAIVLPNSAQYVAALYGCWLAGGIATPLYFAARSRDYTSWLTHSEARVVVADANTELDVAVKCLTNPIEVLQPAEIEAARGPVDAPIQSVKPSDPAMILYTSGTTGRPKGVTLSHQNLHANTSAIVASLGMSSSDSMVNVLPFSFAYGNSVLHSHIQVGAKLILEDNLVFPHKVVERLQNEKATGFAGVPSTYALLLSRVKLEDYDLSNLRYLTQAGGPMPIVTANRLRAALPRARLHLMYGQTEACARLTCMDPDQLDLRPGSVGRPIADVEIQVRPSDEAEPGYGEIWARGPGVMIGYWRDPEMTRATLQDGWLKTGDVGRLDPDGYLYVTGRRSDIIKVGAYRVHPGDIEEVILEIPAVREVAVLALQDELLGQSIAAYIVLNEGSSITGMEVQAHCRARLASYKVPKRVEMVASLPRTASGKIRRFELESQVSE